jgi:hypothetical protein
MPYKRKMAEEEIHRELAQDSDSDCDSELEEFSGPDEAGMKVLKLHHRLEMNPELMETMSMNLVQVRRYLQSGVQEHQNCPY